jgi:hypothetical protein
MMRRTFFSLFDHRPACVLFPGGGVQRRLRSSSRRCCSFVRYDAIVSFLLSERLCMLRLYAHVGYSWGSVTMTRFTSFVPITLSLSMCRGSFCINCNRFQKDPYVFPQIQGANFYSKEIFCLNYLIQGAWFIIYILGNNSLFLRHGREEVALPLLKKRRITVIRLDRLGSGNAKKRSSPHGSSSRQHTALEVVSSPVQRTG